MALFTRNEDRFEKRRRGMVEQHLRARGLRDERVLAVMLDISRERFVPRELREDAYEDRALGIDEGQTISQPFMVAYMTELLDVRPDSKVLEIGTGSGYQTAVLARLARSVHTVERLSSLSRTAETTLAAMGATSVHFHLGDGSQGLPAHAPFDRILVTAGAPRVPRALTDQLADAGRLVIPIGGPDEQTVYLVTKNGTKIVEAPKLSCRFVRLIGQQGWRDEE
jgi:protein-L-isoaspartate(D-aspartate) O-methyltransferase